MLPPELWTIVFRWATQPSLDYPPSYYEPFRDQSETFDESLRTRRALVQVCHLWRALAIVFFYEDLRIRCGLGHLKIVLADRHSIDNREYSLGRFVHRLELPYTQTTTEKPGDTHDVAQILSSCPSLKTLIRPYLQPYPYSAVRYEFLAEIVSLPSLTRLEWWHHNNAARSGGINSLVDVLCNAPCLQYLTLGGEFWINSMRSLPLRLPALTTLRLKRVNAPFVWQIRQWELPSLVHVVADFPVDHSGLEQLWLQFGGQLCTVEFGRNIAFHMTDQISTLLRGCASIKIFNYYINFTAPPTESLLVEQSSLQYIGIHALPCGILNDNWKHLNDHIDFLSSHFLPSLKSIVLYGDWEHVIEDSRLSPALDRLAQKGCTVLFAKHLTSPCSHL